LSTVPTPALKLTAQDVVLATLPGTLDSERVLVVCQHDDRGSRLILRQQSYAEGIGWYSQQSVELDPAQVGQLKLTLGQSSGFKATTRPASARAEAGHALRIVSA